MANGWQTMKGYTGWDPKAAAADYAATGGAGKEGAGGGAGGTSGPDLAGVPSVQEYVKGQFASEDPALQEMVMAMKAREKPADIYGKLEEEAGLPAMRTTAKSLMGEIASLEDYLRSVEPSVSARSRESLMTEAQRSGLVQETKRPWIEKLSTVGTALGRLGEQIGITSQGISTKVTLALQGQAMDLEPLELQFKTLMERNQRMLVGFTSDRQTQLDQIYSKWERTNQLSDQEWQLANTLGSEESSYLKGLKASAADLGIKLTGGESADSILSAIAIARAETISYERAQKAKTAGGTPLGEGSGTTPTEPKPTSPPTGNLPSLDSFWTLSPVSGSSAQLRY